MRLRIFILCACFLSAVPVIAQPELLAASEKRVDANLFAHQASLVPNLKKIGSRVYGAEFMGYSNFGFIDTSEGIVVVDAGWFPGPTAEAVRLLRERTSKPVVAIIYTHTSTTMVELGQSWLASHETSQFMVPRIGKRGLRTVREYNRRLSFVVRSFKWESLFQRVWTAQWEMVLDHRHG